MKDNCVLNEGFRRKLFVGLQTDNVSVAARSTSFDENRWQLPERRSGQQQHLCKIQDQYYPDDWIFKFLPMMLHADCRNLSEKFKYLDAADLQ